MAAIQDSSVSGGLGVATPDKVRQLRPSKAKPRGGSAAKPRRLPSKKPLKLTRAEQRTFGQVIAACAGSFLPIASFVLAHHETDGRPWMWALVLAALTFSAPTLVEWARKWCNGLWKAVGFTVLLEGVMILAVTEWLSLCGLAILVAINCHSAWHLAGLSHRAPSGEI